MNYQIEVHVRELPVRELLEHYRNVVLVSDACRLCPHYGKVWSCPPDLPDAYGYLEPYEQAFVIAVKVMYPEAVREMVKNAEDAQMIRDQSYEPVKKQLLRALLSLEEVATAGKTLGAGRCILCDHCTRAAKKPCRYPEKRRYSVTGFGFDFTKIFTEIFNIALLWSKDGLPEYDVAVAMFVV